MAFDGILVRALQKELQDTLADARVQKIAQPEKEELLITFKTPKGNIRLLMSGSASLPFVYLTDENRQSPMTAPGFTMLLRKHIGSGRLVEVSQPGLERVLDFLFESPDEMGDICEKHLLVELMGKYSNIILTDRDYMILDAIRRVPPTLSSVRTVLPGKPWFIPETQGKRDLLSESREDFASALLASDTLPEALSRHYTGISVQSASEFVYEAGFDGSKFISELSGPEKDCFSEKTAAWKERIAQGCFSPSVAYEKGIPVSYSAMGLPSYENREDRGVLVTAFDSPSEMLRHYLSEKNTAVNMRQRSADLRKVVQTLIDRNSRKLDLQQRQLKDTEKTEKLKLFGELLNAWSFSLPTGRKSVTAQNYYTGEDIVIPTDPDLSVADNARKYFERYGKLKRTAEALSTLIPETEAELLHLQEILLSIDQCTDQNTLSEIREEMASQGYVKRDGQKKGRKEKIVSEPYRYRSSDGFEILVGKNNLQNDRLTMRIAEGADIFMHAKKMPGSHVIIRTGGKEVPDRTYEEGGALAAYYSAGRDAEKVEIDYVRKKEVKKPAGAKPGYVVYYTNYSLIASPDISGIERIS